MEYIQYTRLVMIDEKNCSKNGKRLKGKCKNGKCPPWHVSSLERVLIGKCPQQKVPRMAMDSVPMANVKFLEWQVSKWMSAVLLDNEWFGILLVFTSLVFCFSIQASLLTVFLSLQTLFWTSLQTTFGIFQILKCFVITQRTFEWFYFLIFN